MKKIIKITNNTIEDLGNMNNGQCINILYGAGSTGKECLKLLEVQGIRVDYFCDDDSAKWGTFISGIEVISSAELGNINRKINLVMTSIYAKHIYVNLPQIEELVIYELFSIYGKGKGLVNDFYRINETNIEEYGNKFSEVEKIFSDELSKYTLNTITNSILEKDENVYCLEEIASSEECYFINEILKIWNNDFVIVDAGAYNGEIARTIDKLGISYKKLYCFEVEDTNYKKLLDNADEKTTCINLGLWRDTGKIYIEPDGAATKIVNYETKYPISVTNIDTYFEKIHVDFVKMDIEGAEFPALEGGLKVLKRDRPTLAISIYHSLDDFINIPIFLKELLPDYVFLLRHHSMIFAETVIYGIPKEVM